MTNKPHGTLYIGVTSDLVKRVYEHKQHVAEGFTKRYNLDKLVFWECFETIEVAIQKEKTMKHWVREWKVRAIESINPSWDDLCEKIYG